MTEEVSRTKIADIITPDTKPEEFVKLASDLVTDEDRELFGDEAEEIITGTLLATSLWPPYPNTFGSEAFAVVADHSTSIDASDVDPDRINRLLTIAREQGIIKVNEEGRLYTNKNTSQILRGIFERLPED